MRAGMDGAPLNSFAFNSASPPTAPGPPASLALRRASLSTNSGPLPEDAGQGGMGGMKGFIEVNEPSLEEDEMGRAFEVSLCLSLSLSLSLSMYVCVCISLCLSLSLSLSL